MSLEPQRLWTRYAIVAALWPLEVWAQAAPIVRPPNATKAPRAANTAANPLAMLVLVDEAGRHPELGELVTELLERKNVRTEVTRRAAFDPVAFLDTPARDGVVPVFVVPGSAGVVRLYFRTPNGERFLLREVRLSAGFDDLGCEQLGQIIESGVSALLLHAGDGLTRAQLQSAMKADLSQTNARSSSPVLEAPSSSATRTSADASPTRARAEAAAPAGRAAPGAQSGLLAHLEGWFALRYAVEALGPELGVAQGPGLEVGLGYRQAVLFRVRLIAERDFPVTVESSLISARLSPVRGLACLDFGAAFGADRALLVSLGAGEESNWIEPGATPSSSVAPAAAFRNNTPLSHAELRGETGNSSLQLSLSLGVDVALVDTHYDLEKSSGSQRERVARPWAVRPFAVVALAFRPH